MLHYVCMTTQPLTETPPTGTVRMEFADALKRARKEAGFSQRDLAARVNINTETINRLENGGNSRTDTIEKIRRALPKLALNSDPYAAEHAARERHAIESQAMKDQLAATKARTIHLIEAIISIEQVQKIQAQALRALTAELKTLTDDKHTPVAALKRALKPKRTRTR